MSAEYVYIRIPLTFHFKVTNIQLFAVFHITFGTGYNIRFRVSVFYFDRCDLYSVPEAEYGHTGYQTATYHTSPPAGR